MRPNIAYCGLDCEQCDAYIATLHDDQALREKTAKLWAELRREPLFGDAHLRVAGQEVNGHGGRVDKQDGGHQQ